MIAVLLSLIAAVRVFFLTRTDIAIEVVALRQQVAVLKRKRPRPRLSPLDRLFWTVLRSIRGLTFQSLRRTFATHFHRVGTVKDQQAQMRHSNAQTTMNIYTQAISESLKTAMEEFDKKMSGRF